MEEEAALMAAAVEEAAADERPSPSGKRTEAEILQNCFGTNASIMRWRSTAKKSVGVWHGPKELFESRFEQHNEPSSYELDCRRTFES